MGLRDATIDRERRDLVTHQVMEESRLIRFVAAPDGSVAPDLGRKLPGRGLWVAEREDVIVGCAAMDRGDLGTAVLRRLAGGGLDSLLEAALTFASTRGHAVVETVLPPGLPGTQDALGRAGFTSPPGANSMLLRRTL